MDCSITCSHLEKTVLDDANEEERRYFTPGAHTILKFDDSITDGQILTLVSDAFDKMVAQLQAAVWNGAPIPHDMRPSVMTAFIGPSRETVILP